MEGKIIAVNKKARHDYEILETYEAGIALSGTEVKSLRAGRVNLKDSFARIENGELFLYNVHINEYEMGNRFNHDPTRIRKLLMHKREIMRLFGTVREKGLALIPLKLYFSGDKVKVELALARGKRAYDKRESQAKKDAQREMEKAFSKRNY